MASTFMPPLGQLAISGLTAIIQKVTGAPKPPAETAKTVAPGPASDAKAGLAYTVFRVDSAKKVTLAKPTDTYKVGEGVAISITNNVPGILDIDNIDGAGARTAIETVRLPTLQQTLLPAKIRGFYVVNPDSKGDEQIELRFFPCKPSTDESMGAAQDEGVADQVAKLAPVAALKPDVLKALGACPSKSQRDAVRSVRNESMGAQADTMVAQAAEALVRAVSGSASTPVIIRVAVKRAS